MKNFLENRAGLNRPTLAECPLEDMELDSLDSEIESLDSEIDSLEWEVDLKGVEEDRELIGRCLAGDVKAWEDLYQQCHPGLLSSIKVLLGRGNSDLNLVDEIAARVWYALVAEDGRLLARYDADRGCRLITFLAAIAKSQAKVLFRAERRRRIREKAASRNESDSQRAGKEPTYDTVDELLSSATMAEFIETLTPSERGFLADSLARHTPQDRDSILSSLGVRQLRHRVRQKLRDFLKDSS